MYSLKAGDKVNHKHYGICNVQEVMEDMGVVVLPDTKEGKEKLSYHSGMPIENDTPLLEHSCRMLSIVNNE